MTPRTTRLLCVVSAGVCAIGLLSACTSSPRVRAAAASHSRPPSATASPTAPRTKAPRTTPTRAARPRPPAVNPFTGVGGVPSGPVIAVKIDDTPPGRPQRSIDRADIVYIEQAEGGLTRLVGVFGTSKPTVGYVRSVRTSDPELLAQYGPITLAASGGGGDSLPALDASHLKGWILDRSAPFYARDTSRASSYINVTLDLAAVAARLRPGGAKSMGFTWSRATTALRTRPAATRLQTMVGSTGVRFDWDARTRRYVRVIDGVRQTAADGAPVATPNVVVQFCRVSVHGGDVDVNGNPSQYTHSVGSGRVAVFRDGRRIDGRWSRPAAGAGTVLTDRAGKVIPLAPGGAWVVLVGNDAPLQSH